ncbi:flagellar basal body P-ring formation chaperone FlgA [Amaricoccus sp.]|uniref:flagellar basal body P-ring formation chaperone FlgA n=1 Tax=Amaricoccus sp. TaxID=1872485 RepID=UPI001B43AD8B|nr:flagellar basal body P-ring formation chaperone FlgA [Amaricoccus sp.]MBP7001958.1 flagellar basal body P-ring formation protein FlgA [Amaricoccus sp.]
MRRALILALAVAAPVHAASVAPVRAIRAQTVIAAGDLTLLDEETPGAIGSVEEAAGLEAKVTLYPGRPILPSQLGPPALVERNQTVRMVFMRGPLAIEAEGRALDRGGPGERVRVMNLASKQIVTGAVAENGSVEVGR